MKLRRVTLCEKYYQLRLTIELWMNLHHLTMRTNVEMMKLKDMINYLSSGLGWGGGGR